MNFRIVVAVCALVILIVCGAATVVADGRVTTANPNPIDTWKITDLRFAHIWMLAHGKIEGVTAERVE